ncbi:hypothetical protein PO124_12820 [Bacillus licheniformis]|nr:hypothetical protein [Bacillus licheniformis]
MAEWGLFNCVTFYFIVKETSLIYTVHRADQVAITTFNKGDYDANNIVHIAFGESAGGSIT